MRPLEDVRIIAIEQYGAGPFGSVHLADLGAEVIKIEDPSTAGDVGRYIPPYASEGDSLFFETFNRNKRSLALDLTTPSGRQVLEDLVRVSDAVYSNLRGDVPQKLGITYSQLEHLNPAIVCCSLSGFGMTGPRADQPGYDYMLQALTGWMSLTGEPDGPPTKSGTSLVDWSGGFVAALSLLAGLHAARRDGLGTDCAVSLYETALAMLGYLSTWQLNTDYVPQRTRHSAHPSMVPFQAFQATDGWLVVACPKEKFWQRLTRVIDRAELAADDRFGSFAARHAHDDVLTPILEEVFAQRSVEEWLDVLSDASVPCAPVQDVATAMSDEHNAARGLIISTEHPRYGQVRMTASPDRVGSPTPSTAARPGSARTRTTFCGRFSTTHPNRPSPLPSPRRSGRPPRKDGGPAMSMSDRIVAWAHQLTPQQVPAEVQQTASRHLLDGLATAVAAVRAREGMAAVEVAIGLGGPPETGIIGTGYRGSAPAAAMANGTLVHALDFDDTHAGGLVHATAAVLPAAFAVGQERGASGSDILTAAVAGYETVCRLAAAAPERFHSRGAHPTSVCGAVAAAVIAGKLLHLTAPQMVHAMGIAVSQAGGLMEFLHSGGGTKPFHAGWASHAGIIAARLAAVGMTGPRNGLEGEFGLYQVFADARPDEGVLESLGNEWEIEQITIKPYPACQLIHASLDAARQLRETVADHRTIRDVTAYVPSTAALVVCEPPDQKVAPSSPYDAKFSLPWSVAAMLVDGEVGVTTYSVDQLDRADVAALSARVRHVMVDYDGPDAEAPGHLLATIVEGERVEALVRRSCGTPANPLGADALRAKVIGNLGGGGSAERLADAVTALAQAPRVDEILELTQECATAGAVFRV